MKVTKKTNYVSKLNTVMEEGKTNDRKDFSTKHKVHIWSLPYGASTNRLNELHQDDCPRVRELGHIIDMFVNTIASGKSCMSRRKLVKIGFEILNQRDKATENTRKHMTI